MEGHGRIRKLVECSVSVTIYQHVWPGDVSKLPELSYSVLYQLNLSWIEGLTGPSVERSMRIILSPPTEPTFSVCMWLGEVYLSYHFSTPGQPQKKDGKGNSSTTHARIA